jgi:hypothetical protein
MEADFAPGGKERSVMSKGGEEIAVLYFEWKKTLAGRADEHHYIRNERNVRMGTPPRAKVISKKDKLNYGTCVKIRLSPPELGL